jgi:1-acyl-sn-glycerol-3-phosphate acyltransferase
MFGLTYKVEGVENLKNKQYIMIVNHQSFFDTAFASTISSFSPKNLVAIGKKSLKWVKILFYYLGSIFWTVLHSLIKILNLFR